MPIEEDEELVPVYVGDPPEPRPVFDDVVVDKPNRNGVVFGGKTVAEIKALYELLSRNEMITVKTAKRVMEASTEITMQPKVKAEALAEGISRGTHEINHNKAGASIKIEPNFTEPSPDLMVCEYCQEMLE